MKIFVTYEILLTKISKMNVGLFHKLTYTLISVQSTTTYQRDNLHELKSKNKNLGNKIKKIFIQS